MKNNLWRFGSIVLCVGACTGLALADDAKKPAPGAEEKAMMEVWMKYMTPGDAHKKMAEAEGKWTTAVKEWMAPNAPAADSAGSAEFKMILGGRYQQQTYEGTMMGSPFSGFGITGYDNAKKVYQTTWIDSAGTGMLSMTGTYDNTMKTLTETATMDDFMTGKPIRMKGSLTNVDADHMTYEMWMSGPDGKMFKTLEMVYTRVK